jgi:hypothetical protein
MNWITFLAALAMIESGGDPDAVGDHHLKNKAYGLYQIRQPYLTDVNRISGRTLTLDDIRGKGSEETAAFAVKTYLTHYGKRYTRITGKKPTMEVFARMHNGGPNGWKKGSTLGYWQKMLKALK